MCGGQGSSGEVVIAEIQIRIRVQLGFGVETLRVRKVSFLVLNPELGSALRRCEALASLFPPVYLSFLIRKMVCGAPRPWPLVL